jgi:hypothetical protein
MYERGEYKNYRRAFGPNLLTRGERRSSQPTSGSSIKLTYTVKILQTSSAAATPPP